MGQKRGVQDRRARRRLPNQFLDSEPALHCADRNVAERVIGEMQGDIDIKHEPGGEPDLAKAGQLSETAPRKMVTQTGLSRVRNRSPLGAPLASKPVQHNDGNCDKSETPGGCTATKRGYVIPITASGL